MILLRIVDGQGWDSAMVRFMTRSWATHAEYVDTEGQIAFGAYLSGVARRPIRYAKFKAVRYYTFPNIEMAYAQALTQEGKPYDYSAIFGIALNRNWRSRDKWFCSELVAWSAEKFWSLLNPAAPVRCITPRDLTLSTEIQEVSHLAYGQLGTLASGAASVA